MTARLPGSRTDSSNPRGVPFCFRDRDCEDENACTIDSCSHGVCVHAPVPGCVPCQPQRICPPVEVVVIMDTSGSMRDEADALCAGLGQIASDLAAEGVSVVISALGITEGPNEGIKCLSGDVVSLLGSDVPGDPGDCVFPNHPSSLESWGPATAIVAERFPWTQGAARIIVPISDEGPCNGSFPGGCNDPGDDRDAVNNAVIVAKTNGVSVSPIAGTGADACAVTLAGALATGTGGVLSQIQDAANDLAPAMVSLTLEACYLDLSCDDEDECTSDEVCTGGVCTGVPVPGCVACTVTGTCTDDNACTDDVCVGIDCVSAPNFDAAVDCCDPETGALTPLDDDNACTADLCDADTGEVTHRASLVGRPCDDGNPCSVMDVCNGQGGCAGTDVNTIPCTTDSNCFGAVCDTHLGLCHCTAEPELCLRAVPSEHLAAGCFPGDQDVVVHVALGFGSPVIVGGQFLIQYDPTVFDVIDIVPGQTVDPASPFSFPLPGEMIDEQNGTLFYAVGIDPFSGSGTQGPAVMAAIRLRPRPVCAAAPPMCFLRANPRTTRLTDVYGREVPFTPCCTGDLVIRGEAPALACPDSVAVNADAGGVTATVTWDPIRVSGACGADVSLTCTAAHSLGADVQPLIETGGAFPVGLATFECTTTDDCGAVDACQWSIEVRPFNTADVRVQLSPIVSDRPFLRCIEFSFFSTCVEPPTQVLETLEFGGPFHLPGHAGTELLKVPAGNYVCATARDPLHTLRSVSPVEIVDHAFVIRFQGDPFFEGNWLVGGNLNGDDVIDILDFGMFLLELQSPSSPDTPCGTEAPHADFNGDGVVDILDFSFVLSNFLAQDKDACCPGSTAQVPHPPLLSVSVEELERLGMDELRAADLNGDGVLDQRDIAALSQGWRPGSR